MDDLYNWILFGHIVGAATWFGGHLLLEGMGATAKRSGDPAIYTRHIVTASKTSERVMPIAAVMTLGFGIWLVVEGSWEFSDTFISIGFVVAILGFVIGLGFLTPKGKQHGVQVLSLPFCGLERFVLVL
jgi:uncharacterized membrane protein